MLFKNNNHVNCLFEKTDNEKAIPCSVILKDMGHSMVSFDIEEQDSMEFLRNFIKNVDELSVAAVIDKNDPSTVSLILDWKVYNNV